MIFEQPTRPRRRLLRIVIPVLALAAVVVALLVAAAGEQTRAELEYLEEVRTQTTRIARSGDTLRSVMSRLREVDREEFTTAFSQLEEDLRAAAAFAADEPPVESLLPIWSLYNVSLDSWTSGVNALAAAVLSAADNPQDANTFNATADALGEIRSGDALYRDLQILVTEDRVPEPVGPLADVVLTPSDGGIASLAATYVAAAQASTNGLGLRPGLAVSQLVSEPLWQVDANNEAVIPATESVVFSAVVTNSGNVASGAESALLTLIWGDAQSVTRQVEVPPLDADGQVTLAFDAVDVEPEITYEVRVELVLTGPDSVLTDNAQSVVFRVNEP